jgi:dUTP pyrophosphatase
VADGDLRIDIVHLDPDLPLPTYARAGDAGLDLHARIDALVPARGGRALVPTGVAVAIPEGWVGLVVPRSGLALRHGVALANTPGVIDSGYRGELKAVVINLDPESDYHVRRGDRIAQLLVQRVERVSWNVVGELGGDDRGGGFGHSGR